MYLLDVSVNTELNTYAVCAWLPGAPPSEREERERLVSFVRQNNAELFTLIYHEHESQHAVQKVADFFSDVFHRADHSRRPDDAFYNLCIVWADERNEHNAVERIGKRSIESDAGDAGDAGDGGGSFTVSEFVVANLSSIMSQSSSAWVTSLKVSRNIEGAACVNDLAVGSSDRQTACRE